MSKLSGELHTVGIADHVVDERHTTHASQPGATGEFRITTRCLEPFGALHKKRANLLLAVILQAPAVAVRAQHGGQSARFTLGTEEQSRDVVIGAAFEIDFFDSEAFPVDAAVNDRVQRRLLRHRPKAGGHEYTPT